VSSPRIPKPNRAPGAERPESAPPISASAAVPASAAAAGAAALAAEARAQASPEVLAAETTAFVGGFERWSAHKAAEAGASIPRMRLLYAIHCHGPRKMADLAGELDVTPRNVTAIVDGLEAEGLVRRVPHATDRRVTLVELTCNRDNVASQVDSYRGAVGGLFAGMDETDRHTLLRLLGVMRARMRLDEGRAGARPTVAEEPEESR
jgi:DNA-binding MarR family transcriptional regulator